MIADKTEKIKYVYYSLCLLMAGLTIFEVPKIVFYAPVILFAAFVLYGLYIKKPFVISLSALVLLIFAAVYVYFIYDPGHSIYYQAYIHIQAVLMYITGLNFFTDKTNDEKHRYLDNFLLFVSVMYCAYTLITIIYYYKFTPMDLEVRFFYSIWYDTVTKPATVLSMTLVIPMTYGSYSIFFSKIHKKIIGAIFVLLTVAINFQTGTRTLLLLTPVVFVFVLFCYLIFKRKKYLLSGVAFGIIAIIAVICLYIYKNKQDWLYEKFHEYTFYRLFELNIFNDLRRAYAENVIDNFSFTYMGGAEYGRSMGTPHNVWLYIYDNGGIISLAVYCIFTVMCFVNGVRFVISKYVSADTKIMVLTVFSVMLFEFMMEPLILPLPSFYIITIFMLGIIANFAGAIKKKQSLTA